MITTPPFQRDFQRWRPKGGSAQHPIAAPRQPARKPAQRLIVQFLNGNTKQSLHLRPGDAIARVRQEFWRDLRSSEGRTRIFIVASIGRQDCANECHRGYGDLRHCRHIRSAHQCILSANLGRHGKYCNHVGILAGKYCNQIGKSCLSVVFNIAVIATSWPCQLMLGIAAPILTAAR